MNTFLIKIAQFLGFSIPVFAALFVVMSAIPKVRSASNIRYFKDQNSTLRAKEVKITRDVDILFIGSSLCYRGMDTRIFQKNGYKTFNLGSSSQTPVQTKYLLKRYLGQLNPKMVVYSVDPLIMSLGGGVESSVELISNQYLSILLNAQMTLEVSELKLYNTFLYSLLVQNFKYFDTPVLTDTTSMYVRGGFVETTRTTHQLKKHLPAHFQFNTNQLEAFKDILQLFTTNNQPYLVIVPPITTGKYNSYPNINDFTSTIEKHAPFYNFNGKIALNDSLHFYDAIHLNQKGVELYNHEFLKIFRNQLDSIKFKK